MKATFLSRFTPSMMAPEALEAIFVQREKLAERLVELIRESALTPAKHHTLLIGPRGIGKTHLVSLIYHRVRTIEDLRDRLQIAWLREEEWGITSFLDLLLRIFRALRSEYDDAALAERVEALYDLPSDAAERAAAALLTEFVGGRTLLILMENLDDLFGGLGDEGQKRLRAYLQENPLCTILATAQSLFNGVSLQTSPFYGFFRIQHLSELDIDDATRLLTNIAELDSDEDLASFIQTPMGRARIRAMHHLAGGNPRVYVIFSQFLTRETLDDLVEPFLSTLDDLTPYYQARMAWLSPQQRKIVEFLCDRRHAVPVKEIAQRSFMTHQTASSQLKDLREKGYVYAISVGRESYYELREPLMRMSMEVKKHRDEPIRLFVDFLRLWYLPSELEQRLAMLPSDAALEREHLFHALQVSVEEQEDPRVAACLRDYDALLEKEDFTCCLQVAQELVAIRGEGEDWLRQAHCFFELGNYIEALKASDKAVKLDPDHPCAWGGRGVIQGAIGRHKEALVSFERTIEIDPLDTHAWRSRGLALWHLGHTDEALASVQRAVEIRPYDTLAWFLKGEWLIKLGRFEEAVQCLDRYIGIHTNDAGAWSTRALLLIRLGCWEEALASYDRAIELGDSFPRTLFGRVEALLALDRWDEGLQALDKAMQDYASVDEIAMVNTYAIVTNLLNGTRRPATWKARITALASVFQRYRALTALGQGLVQSIPEMDTFKVSKTAARNWRNAWEDAAGEHAELQIALRLLDAAVRYRETDDRRILLELPVEERVLLEGLLEDEENLHCETDQA